MDDQTTRPTFAPLGESGDTFRREFGPMSMPTKNDVVTIKHAAEGLLSLILNSYSVARDRNTPADPRCFATAQTHLETAVMWAVKGLTE